MLEFIKKLFGSKVEAVDPVPYKVEAPKATTTAATSVVEKASEAVVRSVAKPPAKQIPKKQGAPKKPAGSKKGPRKPKLKA